MSRLQYAGLLWAVFGTGGLVAVEPDAKLMLAVASIAAGGFFWHYVFEAIARWRRADLAPPARNR
jgi:hypothetical protein